MSKYRDVWNRARIKLRTIYYLKLNVKEISRDAIEDLSSQSELKSLKSLKSLKNVETPDVPTEQIVENMPKFILHPSTKFKVFWNIVMALLLLYTAVVMPYTLTFLDYTMYDPWGIIDLALDLLFFIDILVNFNSAYFDQEGHLISNRKQITINYLRSWFLLDVAACFPFNLVGSDSGIDSYSTHDYNNFLRLLRLPRLYRLFRVVRLLKMFKHYKNSEILEKLQDFLSIKHSVMKLLTSSLSILLCVHIMACFWFYSSKIEGFNPDTWVSRTGLDQSEVGNLYIVSLYWTVTTLCTVGYGDIHAQTNLEKILSICWMVFSVYFLSFVIGSLSSMLATMDTKENALVSKLAIIDEFAKEAKLSKQLRSRLRYALRYSTEKAGFSWSDKQSIFNELPKHLRYEVAMAMHHGAARHITFFHTKDQVVISAIVPFLKPVFVSYNEFVYKKKEYAEEIYFIVRGRVSYIFGKENSKLTPMQRGSYFGDIEVMLQVPRKYSAKAMRDCELLIMSKELLGEIIEEYPKVWEEMRDSALEKNLSNEKIIVEMRVLSHLMKNGALEHIDVSEFKKTVAKRLKGREEREKLRRRSINMTNGANLSLKDLYDKLETMCSAISSMEKEVESLQGPNSISLARAESIQDPESWQSSSDSSSDY